MEFFTFEDLLSAYGMKEVFDKSKKSHTPPDPRSTFVHFESETTTPQNVEKLKREHDVAIKENAALRTRIVELTSILSELEETNHKLSATNAQLKSKLDLLNGIKQEYTNLFNDYISTFKKLEESEENNKFLLKYVNDLMNLVLTKSHKTTSDRSDSGDDQITVMEKICETFTKDYDETVEDTKKKRSPTITPNYANLLYKALYHKKESDD